jgi:NhaP-type Na+/H+ or K+/H+ antiporter
LLAAALLLSIFAERAGVPGAVLLVVAGMLAGGIWHVPPPLIFKAAWNVDLDVLRRTLRQIVLLAGVMLRALQQRKNRVIKNLDGVLVTAVFRGVRARLTAFLAGMRGALPLALALALPDTVDHRAEILDAVLATVFVTLVLQGLPLHPVISRLYPPIRDRPRVISEA